jgi:hypothetical protein
MELIADALLIAGALGAAFYCRTLARRLTALRDMDSGLGAAIAALSRQVDEMRVSLDAAKSLTGDQTREITQLVARAEMAAGRLELLLASLHEGERRKPIGAAAERRTTSARRSDWRPDEADTREAAKPADRAPTLVTSRELDDDRDEAAAVEAVLRSLARDGREMQARQGKAMAAREETTPDAREEPKPARRRPSIFDEAFDDLDDLERAAGMKP